MTILVSIRVVLLHGVNRGLEADEGFLNAYVGETVIGKSFQQMENILDILDRVRISGLNGLVVFAEMWDSMPVKLVAMTGADEPGTGTETEPS